MKQARRLFTRFSSPQLAVLRRLDSPSKVQDFLDYELRYNRAHRPACMSVRRVLETGKAHCIEGALLAAAAFLWHGREGLLLDLRANPRDDDHVIAPFREKGLWGAVAKSNYCGLRYREPVYKSYGELARSYFEFYYNPAGEKTLREYSAPFGALRLKPGWLDSSGSVYYAGRALDKARHFRIVGASRERALRPADSALRRAEILGCPGGPLTRRRPEPYSRPPRR